MKAVILAGGRGKRLKPITDYVPKPLVPLNNVPILEWQIRYLKKFGIKDVIICTGYKTNQIENFLKTKNNLGVKIQYSVEKTPLGTGGAIKKIGRLIQDESFLVINGDVITDIDIKKLKSKINSIAAIPLKTKYGVMDISDDKIIKFREKKEISNLWMNAGIYHLSKDIIKDLPNNGDIEKTTFPTYAKRKKLNHIKFNDAKWHSIDSYKDMEDCSKEIEKIIK
jgi:NDP-sugar pyrophosphorylase family protein